MTKSLLLRQNTIFRMPIIRLCFVALMAASVTACASRVEVRGNQPNPERLAEIKAGEISKLEIAEVLGSPSNITLFGQETWYYINETVETFAFFEPEVINRQIVVMKFDDQGMLSEMKTIDETSGKDVEMVGRQTPTSGHEIGFFEQIFGNFGRLGN